MGVRLKPDLRLVAIPGEGFLDGFAHAGVKHFGAAELANPLLRFARSQMARSGRAVLDLPIGRKPKSLLRAFVCLLLGHGWKLNIVRIQHCTAQIDARTEGLTELRRAHWCCFLLYTEANP